MLASADAERGSRTTAASSRSSASNRRWARPPLLDAVWTVVRTKDGKSQTGRTTVRESTSDGSFDALAAAHSRAVGRLSQDLANAVRELAGPGS